MINPFNVRPKPFDIIGNYRGGQGVHAVKVGSTHIRFEGVVDTCIAMGESEMSVVDFLTGLGFSRDELVAILIQVGT